MVSAHYEKLFFLDHSRKASIETYAKIGKDVNSAKKFEDGKRPVKHDCINLLNFQRSKWKKEECGITK